MITGLQFLATFCTAIFAGAALYVSLVEHPVRLGLDTAAAVAQWAPSYRRGALMQAPLAIMAFLAAMAAWLLGDGAMWLVGALLVGAPVPYTLVAIMPTNKALLAPNLDRSSPETRSLLRKWGRLHAVRSAFGLVATVFLLAGLYGV